jgi:hypothetical protein
VCKEELLPLTTILQPVGLCIFYFSLLNQFIDSNFKLVPIVSLKILATSELKKKEPWHTEQRCFSRYSDYAAGWTTEESGFDSRQIKNVYFLQNVTATQGPHTAIYGITETFCPG